MEPHEGNTASNRNSQGEHGSGELRTTEGVEGGNGGESERVVMAVTGSTESANGGPSSTEDAEAGNGGEIERAVTAVTELMALAMMEDQMEARQSSAGRDGEHRPRRVEAVLQGLFHFIDVMVRDRVQEVEDLDEKPDKGKNPEPLRSRGKGGQAGVKQRER